MPVILTSSILWKKYYIDSRKKKYPTCNKREKANWIGHILHSNCLLKHVTEGDGRTKGQEEEKDEEEMKQEGGEEEEGEEEKVFA